MGAGLIVCDEIGNEEDAEALLSAANCGTAILASAHAADLEGLLLRPTFARLHRAAVFDTYVGIRRRQGFMEYEVKRRREILASSAI
jgi:stage III sporulation protein AA